MMLLCIIVIYVDMCFINIFNLFCHILYKKKLYIYFKHEVKILEPWTGSFINKTSDIIEWTIFFYIFTFCKLFHVQNERYYVSIVQKTGKGLNNIFESLVLNWLPCIILTKFVNLFHSWNLNGNYIEYYCGLKFHIFWYFLCYSFPVLRFKIAIIFVILDKKTLFRIWIMS